MDKLDKNKNSFKKWINEIWLGVKNFFKFCYEEISFTLIFLAMLIYTLATAYHANLIVTLQSQSIGFPMFVFCFFSVVNFCAAIGFMKTRTLTTAIILTLISGIVVWGSLTYLLTAIDDPAFTFSGNALISFAIVVTGMILTILGLVLGIVLSFVVGKKDKTKRIVIKRNKEE
ncbi:MAG: hypothetical protein PHO86_05575 [Bacilli bacterium]|nr:hypothetical protein [Bacilli bacterium]